MLPVADVPSILPVVVVLEEEVTWINKESQRLFGVKERSSTARVPRIVPPISSNNTCCFQPAVTEIKLRGSIYYDSAEVFLPRDVRTR